MYMLFQVIGAFIGSLLLYILTENVPGLEGTGANDLQVNVSVLGGLLAEQRIFDFDVTVGEYDRKSPAGSAVTIVNGETIEVMTPLLSS